MFLGSGTLKKSSKYGLQNAGCKKQDHCYSKREEARLPLLFLTLFLHLAFCNPYFWPFFSGSQTDPCFQNKNSGCRLTGQIGPLNNCQRKCSLFSLQKKRGHLSFIYSQSKMTGCTYICKENSFDVYPRKWHDDIKFSFILATLRIL